MGRWGRRSKMEMVSKQERQENWNSRLFVFPQEEEMFWLDIFCKLQQALKSMFDAGHFVSPQPSSHLSLTHSVGVYSVCLFVQLLLDAGSHYCSLSRPGLIVSHLTISELCTKLAACGCRVGEEGWRIPQQNRKWLENELLRMRYKTERQLKGRVGCSPSHPLAAGSPGFTQEGKWEQKFCWWGMWRGTAGELWEPAVIPQTFHCSCPIMHFCRAALRRGAEKYAGVFDFYLIILEVMEEPIKSF